MDESIDEFVDLSWRYQTRNRIINRINHILKLQIIFAKKSAMFKYLLCTFLVLQSTFSFAFLNPIKDLHTINGPLGSGEEVARLSNARVLLADYELIQRDFPHLSDRSHEFIDNWLLEEGAWIALTQIKQGRSAQIHTDIPHSSQGTRKAYRPIQYNRAMIFEVSFLNESVGLFDVKGVGAVRPELRGGLNGLASMSEMIGEYAKEKLVHQIFVHSKEPFDTVESYAVIDMGFHFNDGEKTVPAAAIIRQAHNRDRLYGMRQSEVNLEFTLRKYGLTSNAENFIRDYNTALHELLLRFHLQGFRPARDSAIQFVVADFGNYAALDSRALSRRTSYSLEYSAPGLSEKESWNSCQLTSTQPKVSPVVSALAVSLENWGIGLNREKQMTHFLDTWTMEWSEKISQCKAIEEYQKARWLLSSFISRILEVERNKWDEYGRP